MTHSKLTTSIELTSDSSSRNGAKVDRFIVHHAATTSLQAILNLFKPGGRTVSANYALKDNALVCTVDEDRRAWTSASASWDGRGVTIEVANSRAGGTWPVSIASFHMLAKLIADVAARYGFTINDTNVITHQELWTRYRASYATACPGDLQRRKAELLKLANDYRAGIRSTGGTKASAPVKATPARVSWEATAFGIGTTATKAQWKTIQSWLKRLGRYDGPADGVPGRETWKGIQRTVTRYGYYSGPIDGEPGVNTAKGMQKYAARGGGYTGPVDGILGQNSWAGFVKRLAS